MALPSLILRLEQLAPTAAPVPLDDVLRVPEAPRDEAPSMPRSEPTAERLTNATSLSRWSAAVAAAHDACFVLDVGGAVISVSVAGVELLGSGDATVIGRHILDVINLVDLESGAASPEYAPRITPLVTLEAPGLARSLMRVRHADGSIVTLDTSSAPIHDVSGVLLGSLTFIAPIPAR
jgi:PAS domain S-box-containing protein